MKEHYEALVEFILRQGEQQIKSVEEGQRVDFDLHFIKPFEGKANAWIITEAVSDHQTKIKWGTRGKECLSIKSYEFICSEYFGQGPGDKSC